MYYRCKHQNQHYNLSYLIILIAVLHVSIACKYPPCFLCEYCLSFLPLFVHRMAWSCLHALSPVWWTIVAGMNRQWRLCEMVLSDVVADVNGNDAMARRGSYFHPILIQQFETCIQNVQRGPPVHTHARLRMLSPLSSVPTFSLPSTNRLPSGALESAK